MADNKLGLCHNKSVYIYCMSGMPIPVSTSHFWKDFCFNLTLNVAHRLIQTNVLVYCPTKFAVG